MKNWLKENWKNYLMVGIKFILIAFLIWIAYYAFLGFLDVTPDENWTPGETYPY